MIFKYNFVKSGFLYSNIWYGPSSIFTLIYKLQTNMLKLKLTPLIILLNNKLYNIIMRLVTMCTL